LTVSFGKPSESTAQLSVGQTPFPFRSIVTDGSPALLLLVSSKVGMKRLALRAFTFSNGVTIPAGTLLALPVHSVHMDEEIYPKAHELDGFRFLKLREKEGDEVVAARHQLVTTMGGPPIDSGPPIDNLLVNDQFFVKSLLFFFLSCAPFYDFSMICVS